MKAAPVRKDNLKYTAQIIGVKSGNKVRTDHTYLAQVSKELERLQAAREQIITDAFSVFEKRYVTPAALLLQHFGDSRKAARWLCSHQKVFGGRTAYDVIVEGDDEMVWDEIQRIVRMISVIQYA
ncbi:DUF2384 domain-containing protein [Dyella dinghuensis]|uniref:DUF2384 domain-containing protein n=1 Tax=Dyella dinghuensis TaxID=1920169 RepID=A0A432LUU2_9GAMM|nr:antitoxin Xre/MbcA/ParS toxin-binding domain-containing protein [Dyella dinghuensis]RUL65756.1 DUF2384 domain-containing protein [Dyella dinghuensis]